MRTVVRFFTLLGPAIVLGTQLASAEVADSAAGGFTVKTSVEVRASAQDVYKSFIRVGDWWDASHTYSGDAHNLRIEEKAEGCFCETLPNQGVVRHMEVVYLDPGKMVRLTGGLGPLQAMAATGSMT